MILPQKEPLFNLLKSYLLVGLCFFSTASWPLNPPHDASNTIYCDKCHGAQRSSGFMAERTAEEQETMCRSCHNSGGSANSREGLYQVALHTVESGGETTVIRCGACHAPHGPNEIENPHTGQTTDNLSLIRTDMSDYVSQALSQAVYQPNQIPQDANTFVFNEAPFSGICQTCHQNTDYWKNNGALDDPLHNYGSTCTDCHTHETGFQPGGCTSCHQQAPLSELPRFANTMHHVLAVTEDAECLACHNVSEHASVNVTRYDWADVPAEIYEPCIACHHNGEGGLCTACHDPHNLP